MKFFKLIKSELCDNEAFRKELIKKIISNDEDEIIEFILNNAEDYEIENFLQELENDEISSLQEFIDSNDYENNENFIEFLDSIVYYFIQDIEQNVFTEKQIQRTITSDLNEKDFIHYLVDENPKLGIYWSINNPEAHWGNSKHKYEYTFIANINEENIDKENTIKVRSDIFTADEDEIRLKENTIIKLIGLKQNNKLLNLPYFLLNKDFKA